MGKKMKLKLDDLAVQSFITNEANATKGGTLDHCTDNFCTGAGCNTANCSNHGCNPGTLIAEQCNTQQYPCGGTNDCTQGNCTYGPGSCAIPGTLGPCCVRFP